MKFENANLTEGHIARHTPTGSGAPGREAAIIDIAQDFLLSYLEDKGKMDHVSLRGGTAIRKLYAGKEGRFSLDLDFSIDDPDSDPADRTLDFISEIDGLKIGPFSYSISERRNKWYIGISSPYNDGEIFRTKYGRIPMGCIIEIFFGILHIHHQFSILINGLMEEILMMWMQRI